MAIRYSSYGHTLLFIWPYATQHMAIRYSSYGHTLLYIWPYATLHMTIHYSTYDHTLFPLVFLLETTLNISIRNWCGDVVTDLFKSTTTDLKLLFHSYDRVNYILPNRSHDNLAELSRKINHIFENINEYLYSVSFR